jgi:hypothetical protein
MSAFQQQPHIFQAIRPLPELEAMREISHQASAALDAKSGLAAVAHSVLRVPGIARLTVELQGDAFDWTGAVWPSPVGSAIARVVGRGRIHGKLRIEFGIASLELSSPVRFAHFVGQQVAAMLVRIELLQRGEQLRGLIAAQAELLASRKALQRAQRLPPGALR